MTGVKITDGGQILSLSEATSLTGFSVGKFRAHKDELRRLGVKATRNGWEIPTPALVAFGWLAPEKVNAKPQRKPSATHSLSQVKAELKKSERARKALEEKVAELEARIADLQETHSRGLFPFRHRAK